MPLMSERVPVIDPDVVAFMHSGVAVRVATRDDDLRPEFARAWGPRVSTDGRSLRLCVTAPEGSRMRANLTGNGAVAIGFCPPTIARAVQVKGVATAFGEPDADDLAQVERHFALFSTETAQIGAPEHLPGRMFLRSGLFLVECSIDEVYDQTPGPTAGRRL